MWQGFSDKALSLFLRDPRSVGLPRISVFGFSWLAKFLGGSKVNQNNCKLDKRDGKGIFDYFWAATTTDLRNVNTFSQPLIPNSDKSNQPTKIAENWKSEGIPAGTLHTGVNSLIFLEPRPKLTEIR